MPKFTTEKATITVPMGRETIISVEASDGTDAFVLRVNASQNGDGRITVLAAPSKKLVLLANALIIKDA